MNTYDIVFSHVEPNGMTKFEIVPYVGISFADVEEQAIANCEEHYTNVYEIISITKD